MQVRGSNAVKIDPAKGLVGGGSLIYVLRFSSGKEIDIREFCAQAQTILYDDIGSIGHFRVTPLHRRDLNEKFILGHRSSEPPEFMPRKNCELFVSFIIRMDESWHLNVK